MNERTSDNIQFGNQTNPEHQIHSGSLGFAPYPRG